MSLISPISAELLLALLLYLFGIKPTAERCINWENFNWEIRFQNFPISKFQNFLREFVRKRISQPVVPKAGWECTRDVDQHKSCHVCFVCISQSFLLFHLRTTDSRP